MKLLGNSDSLIKRVGISLERSSELKISFKFKGFFKSTYVNDTLDVLVNYNSLGKIDFMKIQISSTKNATFYQINSKRYVIKNNELFEDDVARNFILNYNIYEYLLITKGYYNVYETELPSTIKVNTSKKNNLTHTKITKRDVTNIDTITCEIKTLLTQNRNNQLICFSKKTSIFKDFDETVFNTIKSNYFYDTLNTVKYNIYSSFKRDSVNSVIRKTENQNTSVNIDSIKNSLLDNRLRESNNFKLTNFTIKSLTNDKITDLKSLINDYILVKLTYISCAPCVISIPDFEKINLEFGKKIPIINVNVLDDKKSIASFNKKQSIKVKTYYNTELIKMLRPDVTIYPTFLLLNNNLEVLFKFDGYNKNLKKILSEELKKLNL
jgi:hypothetical protein